MFLNASIRRQCHSCYFHSSRIVAVPDGIQSVLLVNKMTRFELHSKNHGVDSSNKLKKEFPRMWFTHVEHHKNLQIITKTLEDLHIETKVLSVADVQPKDAEAADLVMSAGGDGTFLSFVSGSCSIGGRRL
eukprot:GHVL01031139.1.p1 GENE.GHVL01031139.1~~GHVL01031139.1.p1  ORF type:complete len:131 (-),score=9.26 GHVL01031139.1:1290-1682(-)